MRVAVVTRHAITNYGSLLQTMATQQIIENLGYTCEIIDYIRENESYVQYEKTLLKQKPEWNGNPVKRLVYLALREPESIVAGRKFEKWRKEYLKLTVRYCSLEQLNREKPIADVYLTGSDQVWGPVADGSYDSAYCLSFTQELDKRVAYAASFGHTDMAPQIQKYYKKWLNRYSSIAVREDSAVEVLSRMGLKATQVMDPTLLLDDSYWSEFTKPLDKEYVLVYQLHNDKQLGEYAQKVAESMGLPLIRVSASFHQINRGGKFVWCPDIGTFLSYIKNAVCMITDSFHGTSFALNFNTPFVEVLPNNNTGTRNKSLLKITGLSNRILTDMEDVSLAKRTIDFGSVNEILAINRKISMDVLTSILEK